MSRVFIKPLSVNQAWKGQRFKTDKYLTYEKHMLFILPKIQLPNPPFQINYTFGLSNSLSDFDNPVKPLTDILQKKYKFNDRDIFKAVIIKQKVDKGNEFIDFKILHYDSNSSI